MDGQNEIAKEDDFDLAGLVEMMMIWVLETCLVISNKSYLLLFSYQARISKVFVMSFFEQHLFDILVFFII